ncbi:MAG: tRNA 2-selenouridine(34) synthase MnmH [Cypionkella sp.]|nr:tRNA 2-selenouridine(34) synthase MnmH [Cypionkella sp.]
MPFIPPQFHDLTAHGFDTIIDARAPSEFAEDHIPGAINLPVLSDAERAEVGTMYKQVSPFDARKLGAALVAANAARHLQGPLAAMQGGWKPLVYCWRGGQRSGSFAMILGQIGWRAQTLAGGYKAWRAMVVNALYHQPFPAPVVVLGGNTGTGKTALLPHLAARGVQVLDLEGLANHRGSLFGAVGPQPSQKAFETALAHAAARLDPTRPVVLESESSKIGECRLPASIWKAMVAAPRIIIEAPVAARAAHLIAAYPDMIEDSARLSQVIEMLRRAHSAEQIAAWQGMAAAGRYQSLAEGLMQAHYDPRYEKHRARQDMAPALTVQADRLDAAGLGELAARITADLPQITAG